MRGACRVSGHHGQALVFKIFGIRASPGAYVSWTQLQLYGLGVLSPIRVSSSHQAASVVGTLLSFSVGPADIALWVSVSESLSLSVSFYLSPSLSSTLSPPDPRVWELTVSCPWGVIGTHSEYPLGQFKVEEKAFCGFLRASCSPVWGKKYWLLISAIMKPRKWHKFLLRWQLDKCHLQRSLQKCHLPNSY